MEERFFFVKQLQNIIQCYRYRYLPYTTAKYVLQEGKKLPGKKEKRLVIFVFFRKVPTGTYLSLLITFNRYIPICRVADPIQVGSGPSLPDVDHDSDPNPTLASYVKLNKQVPYTICLN